MKNIMLSLMIVLAAHGAWAATDTADDDYKEFGQMRNRLVRMKREVDQLVTELAKTYKEDGIIGGDIAGNVKVDIAVTDKDMVVRADLPGMEKDKIDVVIENYKILKISGARDIYKEDKGPGMVRQERSLGKFERVIELPHEGLSQGITASYKDGVLEVVIPKKVKTKEESVVIKVK